jgi:glutaredoxin-related protein
MPRQVLDESKIHPAIRERIARHHESIVKEVQDALVAHPVVVVGMRQNPVVRKARQALADAGIAFHYIEHGSYLSQWRRRNALKMWTGWPTFPMVFVKGVLIGGHDDLMKLLTGGELNSMLGQA